MLNSLKNIILLIAFCLLFQNSLFGQIENIDKREVVYTNLFQGGINISTNGFFLNANYMWIRNIFYEEGIDIALGYKKHYKEQNTSGFNRSGYDLVYGKLNSLYYLRTGVGQKRLILDKHDIGSIKITYLFFTGFSTGIVKPVYINVLEKVGEFYEIKKRKFDYNKHLRNNIHSGNIFTTGFSEISITPGLYLKGGLNFDYSSRSGYTTSIEMGVVVDFYFNEIHLMEKALVEDGSKNLFIDLYISINFGKKWF